MASKVTLTFATPVTPTSVIGEDILLNGTGLNHEFKATRSKPAEVTVTDNNLTQAKKYYQAFIMDYNQSEAYTVVLADEVVTIEHPTNTHFDGLINNTTFITPVVTTTTERITITASFSYATSMVSVCDQVEVSISFNQVIDGLIIYATHPLLSNLELLNNSMFNDDEAVVEVSRDRQQLLIYATLSGEQQTFTSFIPSRLDLINIQTGYNQFGGFATFEINTFVGGTETTYAIKDNTGLDAPAVYYSNPEFSGIPEGTYLGYAKDKYGCIETKSFIIDELPTNPYSVPLGFFHSDKNSVPSYPRNIVGLTAHNINFLPEERPDLVTVNGWYQVYAESQRLRDQFRSSYAYNKLKVVPCDDGNALTDDSEFELLVEQKSDNIQRDTFLEGDISFNSLFGKMQVDFTTGDEYDINGNIIGSHTYNGSIPTWYNEGVFLKINGEIGSISYVPADRSYVIVNITTNTTQTGVTIQSIHTALDYEEFECNVLFSDIGKTDFRLKWEGLTSETSVQRTELSGLVKVITDEELTSGKWHVVQYYNETHDSHINYKWSLKSLRNIEYEKPLTEISSSTVETELLGAKLKKLNYDFKYAYESNFAKMPLKQAQATALLFDTSEYLEFDGILMTSLAPAEIKASGGWGVVSVQLGIVSLSNQFGVNVTSLTKSSASGDAVFVVVP